MVKKREREVAKALYAAERAKLAVDEVKSSGDDAMMELASVISNLVDGVSELAEIVAGNA